MGELGPERDQRSLIGLRDCRDVVVSDTTSLSIRMKISKILELVTVSLELPLQAHPDYGERY